LIRGDHFMRQKLTLAFACACVLIVALAGAATLRAETTPETEPAGTDVWSEPELTQRQRQRIIDRYRHATWRWQRVMGRPVTRELRYAPYELAGKIAAWKRVAAGVRRHAQNPPHKRQWLCIHRYEGAWNDPNPPYFGGLQMDYSFMATYGRHLLKTKGTADHWTPLEQMWVAERAHRAGRGFYPWPNTARYCGLI
jgi:hypothetical protein